MNITVKLPKLPPPLSACYTNVRGRGRVKTKRYREWINLCSPCLYGHKFITGKVCVEYSFFRPDKRKRDLGNLEKALSDLLTGKLIEDDSMIEDLRLSWAKQDCAVLIKIKGFEDGENISG